MMSQRQWMTSRCTSWMRAVRVAGTRISTSPSPYMPAIRPPSRPVSATTFMPRSCAAETARQTFSEFPDVEIACDIGIVRAAAPSEVEEIS